MKISKRLVKGHAQRLEVPGHILQARNGKMRKIPKLLEVMSSVLETRDRKMPEHYNSSVSEVSKIVKAEYTSGGKLAAELGVPEIAGGSSRTSVPVWVQPNQVWKLSVGSAGIASITSLTMLL